MKRVALTAMIVGMLFGLVCQGAVDVSPRDTPLRYVTCENNAGAGFFWIDTCTGRIWWASPGEAQWVYYGRPEGATDQPIGHYLPYKNKSGGGVFVLDSVSGEGWWANSKQWKRMGVPKDNTEEESSAEMETRFVACENCAGAGFFWTDTRTGKTWWASPGSAKWVYNGHPEGAIAGKVGRFLPHKNKSGGGLFILDSLNGEGWWTNGEKWKRFGKPTIKETPAD